MTQEVTKGLLCHGDVAHCLWKKTHTKCQNPEGPSKNALKQELQNYLRRKYENTSLNVLKETFHPERDDISITGTCKE